MPYLPAIHMRAFQPLVLSGLVFWLAGGLPVSQSMAAGEPQRNTARSVHEPIPLPADATVTQGRLSNGLSFAISPMTHREGKRSSVIFLLQIEAGSLHEEDDQIGAAQLSARFAASGSLNPDPEGFQRTLESLNSSRTLRVYTNFDSTRFVLSVPVEPGDSISSADVARAIDLLGSIVSSKRILPDQTHQSGIERARRDVISGQLAWAGPSQRITAKVLPDMLGDSLLASRIPIYSQAQLEETDSEAIAAFINSRYTPSVSTLVISGPVDQKVVRRVIERSLGPIEGRPPGDPPLLDIRGTRRATIRIEGDPAIAGDVVQLLVVDEPAAAIDSDHAVRNQLTELVAIEALSRRLRTLSGLDGRATLQAGAFTNPDAGSYRLNLLSVSGASGSWPKLTREAVATVRSAREHGFSIDEIDTARRAVLDAIDAEVASEGDASPQRRAAVLASQMSRGDTIMSRSQYRLIAQTLAPGIDPDDAKQAIGTLFDAQALGTLVVSAAASPEPHQVAHQITVANQIDPLTVSQAIAPSTGGAALDDIQPPSRSAGVVALSHAASFDITSATLSSGVRLHHRMMNPGSDRVEIAVSFLGGVFEETESTRGYTEAISALRGRLASRSHPGRELAAVLDRHNIDFDIRVSADAVTFRISSSSDDFERAVRLLGLLATEPVIEPVAFERWRASALATAAVARTEPTRAALAAYELNIQPVSSDLARAGDDEAVRLLQLDRVNDWLCSIVRESPMSVAIVGDVDRAEALRFATVWLGGVSPRPLPAPDRLSSLHAQPDRHGPISIHSELDLATHAAAVVVGFRAADANSFADALALDVAASILTQRLGARFGPSGETSGSVVVFNFDGEIFPDSGRFWLRALVDPSDAETAQAALESELRVLAERPPSDDEIKRAIAGLRERAARRLESSGAWASALVRSEGLAGQPLASLSVLPPLIEQVTPEAVSEAVVRYNRPERSFRITILPRE